ncbi:MAG TPA: lysylphosphatidylglycerol synthase transmembrane domain-containing protein [Candidatus Binatus sp.]|nr:lysylphosphatidylglycerol synthase transmembrane domain-containing protein [Candidatus Binatus sp.]
MIAGVSVSFACLYFATRGTDWARVGTILMAARPVWVAAVMLASLLAVYVRAQRWRVLLRPLGVVPLYPALSATAIGFGASAVLPFRIGELVRPALLGRRIGVGVSAALSSVVLERLFDMLLVIVCFIVVALVYPLPPALRDSAVVLGILALVGFTVLYVIQRRRAATETFVERLLARLPSSVAAPLGPLVRSFLGGLGGLADRSTVVLVLAYSVYLWVLIQLTFLFGFLALDMHVPLVAASLATVVIVAAFVFLPQAPGFIGTWQAGCVVALGFFGVPRDEAVGYSLLTWIISMVMNIGAAGVFLAREDLSPGDLLRMRTRETPAARVEG